MRALWLYYMRRKYFAGNLSACIISNIFDKSKHSFEASKVVDKPSNITNLTFVYALVQSTQST